MTLLEQIRADLNETHANQRRAARCRKMPHPHLDETDDDYEFVESSLERWADRDFRFHKFG